MKSFLYIFLTCQFASSLHGQTDPTVTAQEKPHRFGVPQRPLPPEIQTLIDELGRVPKNDLDRDGWDDLWRLVYGFSRDGRNFVTHLQSDPAGDADGDGISNFEEMLDFRNPWGADVPIRQLSQEEITANRKAAAKAAKANDQRKISRFHELLEERGVLKPDPRPQKPKLPDAAEDGETSYYFPADTIDESRQMLVSTGGGPTIVAHGHLSTGQTLLAWEGDENKLYDVEWADDLDNWRPGSFRVPTVDGIGTWSQFTSAPRRFYRVVERGGATTFPSDPSGGNGTTTFGGNLSIHYDSSGFPYRAEVQVNLPLEPSSVVLVIDGEVHAPCQMISPGVYRGPIHTSLLSAGSHSIHAVIDAIWETTPEPGVPDPISLGVFRTPESVFSLSNHAMLRATENIISPDEPNVPATTEFLISAGDDSQQWGYWRLSITNNDGDVVREWESGPPYEGEVTLSWDGTDDSGNELDAGLYTAVMDYGSNGHQTSAVYVTTGTPVRKMLCVMEDMLGEKGANWNNENYLPDWAEHFQRTSGGDAEATPATESPWGPWDKLVSCRPIIQHLKNSEQKPTRSLGRNNWTVHQWASTITKWNNINALAEFEAGGNPFNQYDIGLFIGHGVACSGGTKPLPGGGSITLPPQHYMPLVKNSPPGTPIGSEVPSIQNMGLREASLNGCS